MFFMKFWYNQSDPSSNTFTKFHQNPIHNYRYIGFRSLTDGQSQVERERKGHLVNPEVTVKTDDNKSAPQGSLSLTADTISTEQYDSWEW